MWDNTTSNLNLLQSEYIQKRIHTFLQDVLGFIQLWNKVYKEKGPQLCGSFDLEKSGRDYIMVGVWIRHYNGDPECSRHLAQQQWRLWALACGGEELKVSRILALDILVQASIRNNSCRSRQTVEGGQSVCTSTGKSRDRCSAPRTGSLCVV